MFGVLLESRALPARRTGGAMLSAIAHAILVCAAIMLTARNNAAREIRETWTRCVLDPTATGCVTWVAPAPARPQAPQGAEGGGTYTSPRVPTPPPSIPIDFGAVGGLDAGLVDFALNRGAVGPGDWCADADKCLIKTGAGVSSGDRPDDSPSTSELLGRLLGTPPRPRYPESMRALGLHGRVLVQFAIDTTGRVDAQSVRVIEASHELFARAVLEVLPRFRFIPAEVSGRRVRMTAQMPFEFTLERR